MKNFLLFLARRMKEPSTMAAISVVGVLVGLPPGTVDVAASCVAGAAAIGAALLPESK